MRTLAVLLASTAACAEQPTLSSTAGLTFEELRARTYYQPDTDLYIVDWDTTLVGEAELRAYWESTQRGALAVSTVNGVDSVWDATQKKQLTFCISDTFGTNKPTVIAALKAASDDGWEKFADVDFIHLSMHDANCTTTTPDVVFNVSPAVTSGEFLARAFRPHYERIRRSVQLDARVFQAGGTGAQTLSGIVTHELGHALGFVHEHIRPESDNEDPDCLSDDTYRGLTSYDSASIMHYTKCNGSAQVLAFTEKDRQGAVSIYGAAQINAAPMAQLMSPADGATVPPSFEVAASIVDGDLVKAELSIDGTLYAALSEGPFIFPVTDLVSGAHQLVVTATDSAAQTTTQTINITVLANDGGGKGDGTDDEAGGEEIVGGCSATGSTGGLVVLTLLGLVRRRRR